MSATIRRKIRSLQKNFYYAANVSVGSDESLFALVDTRLLPDGLLPAGLVLAYSQARRLYVPYWDCKPDTNVAAGVLEADVMLKGQSAIGKMIVMGVLDSAETFFLDECARRDLWCPEQGRCILFPQCSRSKA